jgi:peptidoglycan/LPS O-acetylase OafA/YrhL
MQYVPALDGLRAFAVLLVILSHAQAPGFFGGILGVDIFFLLSGFLITTLLLHEGRETGRISIGHFYLRRALRLYPPLLLLLLLCAIGASAFGQDFRRDILIAGLYLTDYAVAWGFHTPDSPINHTWSLAIEEQFYLLFAPLLVWLRRFLSLRALAALFLLLFAAATAWKIGGLYAGRPWEAVYFSFDGHASGLLLGVLLGLCLFAGIRIPFAAEGLAVAAVALALAVPSLPNFATGIYYSPAAEFFAFFLICRIMTGRGGKMANYLASKPAVFIGRLSYGIYLFHFPVAMFARQHLHWTLTLALTLVLSTGLAWYSYNTIERIARLKARKFRHAGEKAEPAANPL